MTEANALRAQLAGAAPVLGSWSIVAHGAAVEIAACAGLDFILLDMEHGPYDYATLETAIRAAEARGCAPLVRVPDLTASTFQRVLDLGAHGLIVPQIRSTADAARAVAQARFAPAGERGYNPFTRVADYAAPVRTGEGKLAPAYPLVGVIVENLAARDALAGICAVDGVDIVYLGVYDMSLALGCDGDTAHPKVQDFVERSAKIIRAAGKSVAMMVRTEAAIDTALGLGATMLVWGVDAHVLYQAYRAPVMALAARTENRERT